MSSKYILLALLLVAFIIPLSLSDVLEGWQYKVPIYITENSGNDLYDYQILVTLDTASLISQGKMRNDCGDIRFTDSDGITLLNYWIEPNNCNTENTRIWVKVPYIPANSNKTIYLYYGNPEATSLSNGTATFIAFDWKFDGPIGGRTTVGHYHTCALLSNGSIMCWGDNYWGQVGDGTNEDRLIPVQVLGIDSAIAVSTGGAHTCALLSNGTIMCWGNNEHGQLGLGYTSEYEPYPQQVIGIDNAIAISTGDLYTCALLSNGTIMCWGNNEHGQLGLGYTSEYEPTPQQVIGIDNAIAISTGYAHTCALLSNGTIMCWGYNYWGQVGDGTNEDRLIPVQVLGIDSAIAVSTGGVHTCALLSNGTIMCWGYNYFGQLGLGYTSEYEPTPQQVIGIDNAIAISSGEIHTCALLSNGTIMCWGNNGLGQLGLGYTSNPIPYPQQVIGIDNAIAISTGYAHTCALLSNGTIMCWGYNRYGQLGLGYMSTSEPTPKQTLNYNLGGMYFKTNDIYTPHTPNDIYFVRAYVEIEPTIILGTEESIIVTEWLSNFKYRIPITITENSGNDLYDYQVLITLDTASLISQRKMRNDCGDIRFTDSDGKTLLNYWIEPNNCNTENTRIWVKVPYIPASSTKTIYLYYGNPEATSLSNGTATFIAFDWKFDGPISSGEYHTCALLSNGTIMCWGYNEYGQLGIGYTSYYESYPQQVIGIDNAIAISTGYAHTCALLSNGSIMCWGDNGFGQLGIGYTSGPIPYPQQVIGIDNAIAISSGGDNTCALLSNGSIMCWGLNYFGQLGIGYISYYEPTPQPVIGIDNAIAISTSGAHTCALLSNGSIMCWGFNYYGQLGLGYTSEYEPTPQPVIGINNAISISTGAYHTCALLSNGTIICWGDNSIDQLGLGYTSEYEPTPQPVIGINNAISISTGYFHTCALLSNGSIMCWGYNEYGQLGIGYTSGPIPYPQQVIGIDNAISISSGGYHTCALLSNGFIMCWGYNYYGQLGLGYTSEYAVVPQQVIGIDNAISISSGGYHTCALLSNGFIMCWGDNSVGQLGLGYRSYSYYGLYPQQVIGIDNAISISSGGYHTCALLSNGSIMCWGNNNYGQLGIGYTSYYESYPQQVIGIDNAIAISAGYYHTCALLSNGSIMCWGDNYYSQLGLGYTSDPIPYPQQVIGIDNVISISSGALHTCVLLSNGSIMCWGDNYYGQLGLGYTSEYEPTPQQAIGIDNAIAISSGVYHTCALLSNGSIMCWGYNEHGQLGLGYTSFSEPTPQPVIGIDNAIAISAGYYHTCALLSNGTIMCWGDNGLGQLGIGYTSGPIPYPQQVIGIDNAIAISTGEYHTCALSNGFIMCWGDNYYGQLGLGYTSEYAVVPQQTLNYNLGGMYFKTNDIYTPHTPNDIYFVRVYVEIEPTITLGSEESIAIAYLIEVEFSYNWKNIVIEDMLIPNKETHIVIYPNNMFIRITSNTNVGTSIAFYLPNNGYIESLNITFFDDQNNIYTLSVSKGKYSNVVYNGNILVTTPYEEKTLDVLSINMSIIPPFYPGQYTSVIKICVYRYDLDPINVCGFE